MGAPSLFGSLCIRADAGPEQGIGHVMRCLALAQAWQDRGGTATFLTATQAPALHERIRREGFDLQPLQSGVASEADTLETRALAARLRAAWVVVDGYAFTGEYFEALHAAGVPVLAIDDLSTADLAVADLVVNPNLQADGASYPGRAGSRRALAGAPFALLRREFALVSPGSRRSGVQPARPGSARKTVTQLVVTLGGSDPPNATGRILEILSAFRDWRLGITVVVGPANPHQASLRSTLTLLQAHHDVTLVVDPADLAGVVAGADLAISAAGTTCWELASLGVPQALVTIAENQRRGAEALAAGHGAILLGWHRDLHAEAALQQLRLLLTGDELRQRLASSARQLIDGRGSARVTERMAAYPLVLRPAAEGDAELLYGWANDPLTRRMSFSPERISWATHTAWLTKRLADPDCRLSIAEDATGQSVGQARLDRNGHSAVLSFSLAPPARGQGYAARLVRLAAVDSLLDSWCHSVDAWVRPDNVPSVAAFRRAGFADRGIPPAHDQPDPSNGALLFRLA